MYVHWFKIIIEYYHNYFVLFFDSPLQKKTLPKYKS